MQNVQSEQAILDFYTYPPVGGDDWRYTFETAQVRVLEMQMLTRTILLNMANAESFEAAADLLAATEYTLPRAGKSFAEVEEMLRVRRQALRELFADLMLDEPFVQLFRTRDDFANLRLAVRRTLTDKPLGTDYSADGNFPPELIEQIFAEADEFKMVFPDYVQESVEQAVLAYYKDKDIRQIDYAIDHVQAEYNLKSARRLNSIFLLGLFRIQIDLTNIRTLLRLKFTKSEETNVFLKGGYIELERLQRGLDLGYEALGPLFFVTPYYEVVQTGTNYLAQNRSFLGIEQWCDAHLIGFLKSTVEVTAGPQPIIAYLLMKENEIRMVRLILTAKKNLLDTQLILDRIP
ncbi:MAG: V-type ATPase subunit [Phycisphaerae bacterium]